MALNIWEVMLRGSALTARVRSGKGQDVVKTQSTPRKKESVFEGKNTSPAMLILAGVAFSDAGVLVRLLLLGVMPLRVERSYFIALYSKRGNIHY